MACCEVAPGMHICRPDGVREVVPHRRRRRFWCFKCRQHLLHVLMVFRHTQPSWYEDFVWYACPTCHEDNTTFPGY